MDCEFIFYAKDTIKNRDIFICKNCEYKTSYKNAKRECKFITQQEYGEPSLLRKIGNFIGALGQHVRNGMPTVTQEQLEERLEKCRGCELFKKNGMVGGICTHENCGCNIQDEVKFLNKIAWADQKCPIGKWGEIVENGV